MSEKKNTETKLGDRRNKEKNKDWEIAREEEREDDIKSEKAAINREKERYECWKMRQRKREIKIGAWKKGKNLWEIEKKLKWTKENKRGKRESRNQRQRKIERDEQREKSNEGKI